MKNMLTVPTPRVKMLTALSKLIIHARKQKSECKQRLLASRCFVPRLAGTTEKPARRRLKQKTIKARGINSHKQQSNLHTRSTFSKKCCALFMPKKMGTADYATRKNIVKKMI